MDVECYFRVIVVDGTYSIVLARFRFVRVVIKFWG